MGPARDLSAWRVSALSGCGPPGALMTTPGRATHMALPMLHLSLSISRSAGTSLSSRGTQWVSVSMHPLHGDGAVGGDRTMFGHRGGVPVSQVQQPPLNTLSEKPERCGGEVGPGFHRAAGKCLMTLKASFHSAPHLLMKRFLTGCCKDQNYEKIFERGWRNICDLWLRKRLKWGWPGRV